MAAHAAAARPALEAATRGWHAPLLGSSLPPWLAYKVINSAYTLYTNAILNRGLRFSMMEGGMGGLAGTMDQRMVTTVQREMQRAVIAPPSSQRLLPSFKRAVALAALLLAPPALAAVDRAAVVARHDVRMAAAGGAALDTANDVFSVGNGAFAFNADATGLQSCNGSYTHLGVNTLADWGWHSEPSAPGDATRALRDYNFTYYSSPTDGQGGTRQVPYMNDGGNAGDVTSWMMANPHRLNLGQLSLVWRNPTGATAPLQLMQVANASQALRLWSGQLESNFSLLVPPSATCSMTEDNYVATFSCGGDSFIASVPFASYGQPTGDCAAGFEIDAACNAPNSSAALAALCVGKPSCSLLVNFQAGFGDPCPGQAKRLAANITCSAHVRAAAPSAPLSFDVAVRTAVHPDVDLVSANVACLSDAPCPLALRIAFPYGTGAFGVTGADWGRDGAHTTTVSRNSSSGVSFVRELDSDSYRVDCSWPRGALVALRTGPHSFDLVPAEAAAWTAADVSCLFAPTAGAGGALKYPVGEASASPWIADKRAATQPLLDDPDSLPLSAATLAAAAQMWAAFWSQGAFVDLASASNASNAFELERRVVLSLYLLRVNDAGAEPPQETGLLANSWNGKHHNEMRLWHQGGVPCHDHSVPRLTAHSPYPSFSTNVPPPRPCKQHGIRCGSGPSCSRAATPSSLSSCRTRRALRPWRVTPGRTGPRRRPPLQTAVP